ncbi:MAG: hypothetical protein NTY89_15760 [Nostocales cyanobacterium LacPavin_0920_SED1_MAG_38_18]|nr:hypothetical protein [Nostocales cyanobacterium LacPavin_0920_SED1_MAG_38_18]
MLFRAMELVKSVEPPMDSNMLKMLENDVAEILEKIRNLSAKYPSDSLEQSAIYIQLELESFVYTAKKRAK